MNARRSQKAFSAADTAAVINLATDVLLGTAAAARLLGCSPKTLRAMRSEGCGPPCLKLGRSEQSRVVYSRDALESWVRRNARPLGGA